jgi:hypothetical protein
MEGRKRSKGRNRKITTSLYLRDPFGGKIQIVFVCILDKFTIVRFHEIEQIKIVWNTKYNVTS